MIVRILCLMFLFTLVACDRQGAHWEEAQQEDTVAAYESYLASYPDGANADQARNRIDTLRAEQAWAQAQQRDTLEAHREFLQSHSDAAGADEARARLQTLEREAAWQNLAVSVDIDALQSFADEHAGSPEADSARARISEAEAQAEAAAERREREAQARAEAEAEAQAEAERLERELEAQRLAEQGTHRVQLAAVRTEDQATAGIAQLQGRLGEVLGDVGLEAQRTNGLYRLVTQAMSQQQAAELCEAFDRQGQECFVRQR